MRPSIRRRLLTMSVTATLLAVGGAAALVWLMMSYSLRHSLDETLRTEAITLAGRVEDEDGQIEFDLDPHELEQATAGGAAMIQVVADDGDVVFRSQEFGDAVLPIPMSASHGADWFDLHLPPADRPFRAAALQAVARREDEPQTAGRPRRILVYVARSLDPLNETLRRLGGVLALAVVVSGAAALGLGFLVAGRGAAPISHVADAIGQVQPERPELSLDRRAVAVELDPIVRTVESLLHRIRQELEHQRQLTADVAHDLRTPLAGVRTLLDVCVQRPRDTSEYVETIGKAQAALRQLSELLDNVLTLARLDAEIDQPLWTTIEPRDVVDAAIATVQPLAAARRVTIRSDLSVAGEWRSDRAKLTKILSNLLANAIEHSPPGETVILTGRDAGDSIEIAVEDRGPGIAPELRDRVFERFVRGDSSRSTDGHHGLGLPIARGLARLLGGDVWIDAAHTRGTRLVVRLDHGC